MSHHQSDEQYIVHEEAAPPLIMPNAEEYMQTVTMIDPS